MDFFVFSRIHRFNFGFLCTPYHFECLARPVSQRSVDVSVATRLSLTCEKSAQALCPCATASHSFSGVRFCCNVHMTRQYLLISTASCTHVQCLHTNLYFMMGFGTGSSRIRRCFVEPAMTRGRPRQNVSPLWEMDAMTFFSITAHIRLVHPFCSRGNICFQVQFVCVVVFSHSRL